jgi:predicted small secreted protein
MNKTFSIFRMLVIAALLLGLSQGLTACNTMNGVGKDLETAGKTIQDI